MEVKEFVVNIDRVIWLVKIIFYSIYVYSGTPQLIARADISISDKNLLSSRWSLVFEERWCLQKEET